MELSSQRGCPRWAKPPKNGGSPYFNYKGFHSILLMALVDASYNSIWADIEANVSASDAAIFNHSEMKEVIENGTIDFPSADPLPNDERPMSYFIIGDDSFPLRTWLTKPFSRRNLTDAERIFNYRLSRGGGGSGDWFRHFQQQI